ncbi:MAG: hypothetical protein AB1656_26380 [Candidatus Omnitrophota bacterium]
MTPDNRESILRAYRKRLEEPVQGRLARHMTGAGFLFVILFLFLAFYFFWPLVFKTSEPYAPESVIHDVSFALMEMRDLALAAMKTANQESPETLLSASLKNYTPPGGEKTQCFVLGENDSILFGNETKPPFWNEIVEKTKDRHRGTYIHAERGKSTLVMFDSVPDSPWRIIIIEGFPPLFLNKK